MNRKTKTYFWVALTVMIFGLFGFRLLDFLSMDLPAYWAGFVLLLIDIALLSYLTSIAISLRLGADNYRKSLVIILMFAKFPMLIFCIGWMVLQTGFDIPSLISGMGAALAGVLSGFVFEQSYRNFRWKIPSV